MNSSPSPNDPLGWDTKVGEDLDIGGRNASGVELVEDGMLHRLMVNTLPCIGAPNGEIDFGERVQNWIGSPMTPDIAASKGRRLAIVFQRDPRIDATTLSVVVAVAPPGTTFADDSEVDLTITVTFRTVTGINIRKIVGISAVTVAFLAED